MHEVRDQNEATRSLKSDKEVSFRGHSCRLLSSLRNSEGRKQGGVRRIMCNRCYVVIDRLPEKDACFYCINAINAEIHSSQED